MMISYEVCERILTVAVSGEIDHHSSAGLRTEIDRLIRKYSPVCLVLDFAGVDFCDSSGIALVLGRYRTMRSLGGEVELANLPENVRHIFDMADLRRLVKIG